MHFFTLVTLEVLFIVGIVTAQQDDKMLDVVKLVMCDPAFEYMRNAMEKCTKDQNYESDNEMYKYCGIELSSMDLEGTKNYYCNTPMEVLKRDNECLVKKVKEMGKEEIEELIKSKEPLEKCMKEALGASRRK